MSLGEELQNIRNENKMSQEEFGSLFNATRQTISNWEKNVNYPDLDTLIKISEKFNISLDTLLKNDKKMVKIVDSERKSGMLKRKKSVADFLIGAGAGLLISCIFQKDSTVNITIIIAGLVLVVIGWYKHFKISGKL